MVTQLLCQAPISYAGSVWSAGCTDSAHKAFHLCNEDWEAESVSSCRISLFLSSPSRHFTFVTKTGTGWICEQSSLSLSFLHLYGHLSHLSPENSLFSCMHANRWRLWTNVMVSASADERKSYRNCANKRLTFAAGKRSRLLPKDCDAQEETIVHRAHRFSIFDSG